MPGHIDGRWGGGGGAGWWSGGSAYHSIANLLAIELETGPTIPFKTNDKCTKIREVKVASLAKHRIRFEASISSTPRPVGHRMPCRSISHAVGMANTRYAMGA